MIQEESGTSWKEMYEVFNMGHRMELYVAPALAEEIIKISESFDVQAKIVGRVEKSNQKELTIQGTHGKFYYS
jgi:phosphoribosylformylglycinamidine cyclo-ligase